MALLAEELVEEWLNRNGYFTIRGIKLGVHEIDLLALRVTGSKIEARHIEVQASVRPVSYLCPLPKDVRKSTGRSGMSMKQRSETEIRDGVKEWVDKKFLHGEKTNLRTKLFSGEWSFELVVHNLRFPEELDFIKAHGIKVHKLDEIVASMSMNETMIKSASGSDLLELVMLRRE
jgi:hypothetical protein